MHMNHEDQSSSSSEDLKTNIDTESDQVSTSLPENEVSVSGASDNEELSSDSSVDDLSKKVTLDNEARLEQLEKEHETLKSQYMRIAADFDNFRKRQSRDQDDLKLQLQCNTLTEVLPVVDNFERARQQLNPEGEEALKIHRNYQNLYKQLVDVLKKLGVAPMRVLGQTFDPSLHEALLREPSETMAEDIILEELVRGYHLNGRVLRHAQVKVSMGPGPQVVSEEQSIKEDNQPEKVHDSESIGEET